MPSNFQHQAPLGTFTIPKSVKPQQNGQRALTPEQSEPAAPPRSFEPRPGKS